MLLCQQGIGFIELLDVVGAVVRWKGDSGERYLCATGFEGRDDLVKVGAGVRDGRADETETAATIRAGSMIVVNMGSAPEPLPPGATVLLTSGALTDDGALPGDTAVWLRP